MTDLIETLTAQGWRKEHEGGNCHSMRKGQLVLTGFDGDLPQDGWWMIGLYRAPDDDAPLWSESDASAEWPDINAPRDFWATVREGEAQAIALAFADALRADLSAEQWEAMRARNASPEYADGSCASHDFCDANLPMADAFKAVTGRDILRDGAPPADEDAALWGMAWAIARRAYLTAE